ncbi:hypothetical protein [Emticicia sp. SJ17W-69]|uniref:hypothetical protein n=1 Tax=Emticicia sp. SJ17W-69 TaxID=3421657 RepID=UPI003EB6A15F
MFFGTARLDLLLEECHKNALKILSEKSSNKEKLPQGQATGIAMFVSIGELPSLFQKKKMVLKVSVIDIGQYGSPEMVVL